EAAAEVGDVGAHVAEGEERVELRDGQCPPEGLRGYPPGGERGAVERIPDEHVYGVVRVAVVVEQAQGGAASGQCRLYLVAAAAGDKRRRVPRAPAVGGGGEPEVAAAVAQAPACPRAPQSAPPGRDRGERA